MQAGWMQHKHRELSDIIALIYVNIIINININKYYNIRCL